MNKFIFKNENTLNYFKKSLNEDKMSHAYVINGLVGSGRKSLVKYICMLMSCKNKANGEPCLLCDTCRSIINGNIPDISYIQPENGKKNISVDAIREMISKASLTPFSLEFKAFVIDGADKMTNQAQNALLKTLEEPPKNTYIFLVCENYTSLLETIISRVQIIHTEKLDIDDVFDYISNIENIVLDEKTKSFITILNDGTIGTVRGIINNTLSEDSSFEISDKIIEMQLSKIKNNSFFSFSNYIITKIKTREDIKLVCSSLILKYNNLIHYILGDIDIPLYSGEHVDDIFSIFNIKILNKFIKEISEILGAQQFNANIKLSTSSLAISLWDFH